MTRLILTSDDSTAGAVPPSGLADMVVPILHRFVWGPLPSDALLSAFLARRTRQPKGGHWLDYSTRRDVTAIGGRRHSLLGLATRCDSVELWMDTRPNDQ